MASRSLWPRSSTGTTGSISGLTILGENAWSLMRVSTSFEGGGNPKPPAAWREGQPGRRRRECLALVDGQVAVLQLEDGQVDAGDEHRADHAAGPAAVAALALDQVIEDGLLVLGPGELVLVAGAEQLVPAVVAEHVEGLGVVVVGVLVVAEAAAAPAQREGDVALAELEPLLDLGGVVLARGEAAGDGRGSQGRPAVAAAPAAEAVDDAALGVGAVLQVLDALVDDLLGNDDARVARRPQALHLRDGDGAFVKAAAVRRRDVAPAAAVRLCL